MYLRHERLPRVMNQLPTASNLDPNAARAVVAEPHLTGVCRRGVRRRGLVRLALEAKGSFAARYSKGAPDGSS
jgi:hypothetical protein